MPMELEAESGRLKQGEMGEERGVWNLLTSRVVCWTDPKAPVHGASVVKLYEARSDETYPRDWLRAWQRHRLK
jgi:hypothetical protein